MQPTAPRTRTTTLPREARELLRIAQRYGQPPELDFVERRNVQDASRPLPRLRP
jgi:hypothetical protein